MRLGYLFENFDDFVEIPKPLFAFSEPSSGPILAERVVTPTLRQCAVCKRLGIPKGGIHGFRHSWVSFLVEDNAPVDMIKEWIGHGSERMVRCYTHLRPMYRSRVLASIPSLIDNKN